MHDRDLGLKLGYKARRMLRTILLQTSVVITYTQGADLNTGQREQTMEKWFTTRSFRAAPITTLEAGTSRLPPYVPV